MKKYLAEMVGTMVLVLMGCGVAVSLACDPVNDHASVIGTAMAFGLSVVAMAYAIGGISGCHINPAITLGVFLSGRMSAKDCTMYMLFQVIGGLIGAALLCLLVSTTGTDFAAAGTEWSKRYWRSDSRDIVHLCVRTCCSWCYFQDKRSNKQFRRIGNWVVTDPRTFGMYPLYWNIC